MTTCAKCGLPKGTTLAAVGGKACADGDMSSLGDDGDAAIECLERQLSNQSALLRSVTLDLENAGNLLDPGATPAEVATAREMVAAVLERLS
jgi:hypothetical protein